MRPLRPLGLSSGGRRVVAGFLIELDARGGDPASWVENIATQAEKLPGPGRAAFIVNEAKATRKRIEAAVAQAEADAERPDEPEPVRLDAWWYALAKVERKRRLDAWQRRAAELMGVPYSEGEDL